MIGVLNSGFDAAYLTKGRASAMKRAGERTENHPTTPEEVAALATKQFQYAGSELRYLWAHLLLAMTWVEGNHHLTLDPRSWRFVPIPQDEQIPRPMINLARDQVETIQGKLLKNTPKGAVRPREEGEPRSRAGAEYANAAIAYKDELEKRDAMKRAMAKVGTVCGDVFSETIIDSSKAPNVDIPLYIETTGPDGLPGVEEARGPDGQPITQRVPMADESTSLILPIQIFVNQSARSLESAKWIHTFAEEDLDIVRQNFPDSSDQISQRQADASGAQFLNRLQKLIVKEATHTGYGVTARGGYSGTSGDPSCLINVIRFNPDRDYPKGRYFVIAGGVCVVGGPLKLGKILMTHWRYSELPGSFWSSGLIRDLIGLNRHIEQMMYQAALQRRTMAVPFWLVPERSGGSFTGGDLAITPGKQITYKPRGAGYPEPKAVFPSSSIDAGFRQELELFLKEFIPQVAGTRGVLSGERPQGTYSGVLYKMQAAYASDRLSPKIDEWLQTMEGMYSNILTAIKNSPAWQIPQRVNVPSSIQGRRRVLLMSAADFDDNLVYKIETEARGAMDDATKTQVAFDVFDRLAQKGVVTPEIIERFVRVVGVPELIGPKNRDYQKAMDEDAWMSMGEEIPPDPLDDHGIHFMVHREYEMSRDFALLPPEIQQNHRKHTMKTKELVELEEMRQMDKMQAMAGQNGGGGPQPVAALPPGGRGYGGGA